MAVDVNVGSISVTLRAIKAQFTQEIQRATEEARGAAREIGDLTKITLGLGAAATGVALAIKGFTSASQRQTEAELKLASAIKGTGQAIDIEVIKAYAAELQKTTIFGDEVTISAAAMLQSFNLTQDQLLTMIPAIQNLASFMGNDLNQSALQVGRALTMGTGALTRFGITLTDAQKAAFDLGDQTERVRLLAEIINNNFGPAAEALGRTAGGSFARLSNALGDLAEVAGAAFERVLVPLFSAATSAVTGLTSVAKRLHPTIKDIGAAATVAGVGVTAVGVALLGIGAALPVLASAHKAMLLLSASASRFMVALAPLTPFIPVIVAAAAALFGIVAALGAVNKAVGGLDRAFAVIKRGIAEVVTLIASMVPGLGMLLRVADISGDIIATGARGVKEFIADPLLDSFKEGASIIGEQLGILMKEVQVVAGVGVPGGVGEDQIDFSGLEKGLKEFSERVEIGFGGLEEGFSEFLEALAVERVERDISDYADAHLRAAEIAILAAKTQEQADSLLEQEFNRIKSMGIADTFKGIVDTLTAQGQVSGNSIAGAFAEGTRTILSAFLSAAPKLSAAIDAGIKGFQQGGIWGAVVAVFANLISSTEGFARITARAEERLERLVDELEPLIEVIDKIDQLFEPFATALEGIINIIAKGVGGAFDFFLGDFFPEVSEATDEVERFARSLAEMRQEFVSAAATGLENLTSEQLLALAQQSEGLSAAALDALTEEIQRRFDEATRAVGQAELTTATLTGMDALAGAFGLARLQEELGVNALAEAMSLLGTETTKTAEGMRDAAGILNAPSGFKVGLHRLRAINVQDEQAAAAAPSLPQITANAAAMPDISGKLETISSSMIITTDVLNRAADNLDVVASTIKVTNEVARSIIDQIKAGDAGVGAGTTNIDTVTVTTPNTVAQTEDLAKAIKDDARWKRALMSGRVDSRVSAVLGRS